MIITSIIVTRHWIKLSISQVFIVRYAQITKSQIRLLGSTGTLKMGFKKKVQPSATLVDRVAVVFWSVFFPVYLNVVFVVLIVVVLVRVVCGVDSAFVHHNQQQHNHCHL